MLLQYLFCNDDANVPLRVTLSDVLPVNEGNRPSPLRWCGGDVSTIPFFALPFILGLGVVTLLAVVSFFRLGLPVFFAV